MLRVADVLNLNVVVTNSEEGPAYGAAILASVGCGLFKTVDDACRQLVKITDKVKPIKDNVEKYNKIYNIYTSLYDCLKVKFQELSKL